MGLFGLLALFVSVAEGGVAAAHVDPRRTASLLDIFSCSFQGLVPYGAQLLSAAAVVGISPLAITPYCWYPMLIFVFGLLAIGFGFPRFSAPHDDALAD